MSMRNIIVAMCSIVMLCIFFLLIINLPDSIIWKYNPLNISKRKLFNDIHNNNIKSIAKVKDKEIINSYEYHGFTPLTLAVWHRRTSIVSLLLKNGADPDQYGPSSKTPLYIAVSNNYFNIASLLIVSGADINKKSDTQEWTCLHERVMHDDYKMAKYLISKGADVNSSDYENETPLFSAVRKNNPLMVILLINNGADVKHKNKYGELPIDIARRHENKNIEKILARH